MKTSRKFFSRAFWIALAAIFCFSLASGPALAESKKPIRFNDRSWDSIQVHNRIAGFILKNGYGYEVDYQPGETVPLLTGLIRGDTDVDMESWTQNSQEIFDKGLKEGAIVNLGPNFTDAGEGWFVPTYVIKGDEKRGIKPMAPELKSVYDLPKYWELFKDPEDPSKGLFVNSVPGWTVTKDNELRFKAYGLDKTFNILTPGSDAALAGSMVAAYKKGKPWVGYYWSPTWVLGQLDMTALEQPKYTKEVWEKTHECGFTTPIVDIYVNAGLPERAPDAVEMLKKYETTADLNNKVLAYMRENKASTEEGAVYFLKNYEGVWTKWIPADIATKVKAALK